MQSQFNDDRVQKIKKLEKQIEQHIFEKNKLQANLQFYEDEQKKLIKYKNLYEDARIRLQNMERLAQIMQKFADPMKSEADSGHLTIIDSLNSNIKEPSGNSEDTECSICSEVVFRLGMPGQNAKNLISEKLECGHDNFHKKCIKKWITKNG